MTNYVYIATSLDGFIAKKDGDISWLENMPQIKGEDYGYSLFIQKVDALVMGRNTFEKVLTFNSWPYKKPVFVLSTTLKKIPKNLQTKVKIINKTPKEIVKFLSNKGLNNLYIDGGKTIQAFLKDELIDEIIITKIPITLGKGIPLLKNAFPKEFYLIQKKDYSNKISQEQYKKINSFT